jgi:hypothetical protein
MWIVIQSQETKTLKPGVKFSRSQANEAETRLTFSRSDCQEKSSKSSAGVPFPGHRVIFIILSTVHVTYQIPFPQAREPAWEMAREDFRDKPKSLLDLKCLWQSFGISSSKSPFLSWFCTSYELTQHSQVKQCRTPSSLTWFTFQVSNVKITKRSIYANEIERQNVLKCINLLYGWFL